MARCNFCTQLSISCLLDLYYEDGVDEYGYPNYSMERFYQHHQSISNLEQAANNGCDLCQLILDSFKGLPAQADRSEWWPDIKALPDTNVRIRINSWGYIDGMDAIDELEVHVGPLQKKYSFNWPRGLLVFSLRLSTPRGNRILQSLEPG